MISQLESAGLSFVGRDETGWRMELPGHPYYVGVQFHPEFKSRPGKPYEPFLVQVYQGFFKSFHLGNGLIATACGNLEAFVQNNVHVVKPVSNGVSNGI
ncbi:hypothetical protein UlMin_037502 [Ulmus minor]